MKTDYFNIKTQIRNKINKKFFFDYFKLHILSYYTVVRKNHQLELIWTLTPSFIILLLLIPSFNVLCHLDSLILSTETFVTIHVIGNQWFWSYSFFIENTINVKIDSYMMLESNLKLFQLRLLEVDKPLIILANTPIRFLVSSVDVLHSWAIPSLGIKMDACPGRLNQILSLLTRPGDFYGQCSEICGVNHGFMPINIVVLEPKIKIIEEFKFSTYKY